MLNEEGIAEHLRKQRGFRIVDVARNSVAKILAACSGARMLVGIEGSHLMHGFALIQPGSSILAIQLPYRFCGVLKRTTDMAGQHFGFVVGAPSQGEFQVNIEEVERTPDLLPTPVPHPRAVRRVSGCSVFLSHTLVHSSERMP